MGARRTVTTSVFSSEAIRRRRFHVLEDELRRRGLIHERRVGNSRILAVRLRDTIDCVDDMCRNGQYFYDLTGLPERARFAPNLGHKD